jgi:hypothetical protein
MGAGGSQVHQKGEGILQIREGGDFIDKRRRLE